MDSQEARNITTLRSLGEGTLLTFNFRLLSPEFRRKCHKVKLLCCGHLLKDHGKQMPTSVSENEGCWDGIETLKRGGSQGST